MTDYLGPLTLGTSGTYTLGGFSASSSDGGISAAIQVVVTGASADALVVAVEALVAQVNVGNSYVHTTPGATNPVVYRIVSASAPSIDEYDSIAFWHKVSFTLTLAAQPAGALTTLYNAAATLLPASVALSALLGTNPPALDATIDDSSGNDMHSVWAALAPTALSDAKWLVDAAALTWTTMSSGGADAAMWFNHSRYTTSASYQSAILDTSQYPAGKYRLLARVKQAAGTGYVMDSQNAVAVAVTRTTPHLMVIGDLDLPVSDTYQAGTSSSAAYLALFVASDGTNRIDINAFVLLPLEYGYFSWHHSTAATEIDQLDVGPTGTFMWTTGSGDGITDTTYLSGGPLVPRILAAHVGTLVATASPSGSNWPADWGRTNGTDVTAASSKFHIVCAAATTKTATYAATVAGTPIVVPGAWYELSLTRSVTAWSAGTVQVQIVWQDVDGNTVRADTLSSVAAVDGSPVALTLYDKAPVHAARAQVLFGGISATMVADFYTVVLRRCPLRLCLVCEDADGALSSNTHAVALTVRYTPRYEVAR